MKLPMPYYDQDGITIYNGDCREILPLIEPGSVDAVVTDPPYGISWKPRINHRVSPWIDDQSFDPSDLLLIGHEHIFWGANYYCRLLPHSESWLAWVKRPIDHDFSRDRRTYSTAEFAWTDVDCRARFWAQTWDGGKRAGDPSNREFLHPSQKPLELMNWCFSFLKSTGKALDPYAGCGTTLLAAKLNNRRCIGIEIEEQYCQIAVNRLRQSVFGFEPASPRPREAANGK